MGGGDLKNKNKQTKTKPKQIIKTHTCTHTELGYAVDFTTTTNRKTNFRTMIITKYYLFIYLQYVGRKEGNVLFNDALNTFYLRLYGVRHVVKDHSDSERGNPLPPHRLLFPISSKGSFICIIPQTG